MKKTRYRLVLIAIISIYTSMPVFAWLDTLIQRAGESLRPKDTIQNLNNSLNIGNIYSQSYALAEKTFTAKTIQAVNAMTAEFNSKYQCKMTVWDMWVILSSIPTIRNEIQASLSTINNNISFDDQSSFAWACIKMTSCMQRKPVTASSVMTDAGFTQCKNYGTTAYNLQSSVLSSVVSLGTTTVGNDIYYNGTLDDSPYDLLVDIQHIGDILFATNEQTDKVLFYTFPTNSIAWFQAIPFSSDGYTALPDSISLNNNNQNSNPANSSIQNSTNLNTTLQIWKTNSNALLSANNITNNTINNTLTNTKISTLSVQNIKNPTPTLSSNNATIQNYACITPSASTDIIAGNIDGSNTNNNWWIKNPTDWNTNNTSIPNNTLDNWSLNGSIAAPMVFNSNTPYNSPIVTTANDPVGNNDDWWSPTNYAAQEASINSCIQWCGSLPAADKVMCTAKCMCGSTSTKDGIFGLQVCTIPSKQNDVMSSKSVKSIEEIITAINGVLAALRNSGEMTKHTKTTEFLDTSLSKIKLNQIFAFDINIAFKPLLTSKPRKMTDAETQAENDSQLAGNYSSIDVVTEKNKYLVLYNPIVENARNKWGSSIEEVAKNVDTAIQESQRITPKLNANLSQSLAKTQNAEVADIIKQFLDQNLRFRWYANESLTNIQSTAKTIKQKIQSGQ